jgi:hypothetical protein
MIECTQHKTMISTASVNRVVQYTDDDIQRNTHLNPK